MAKNSGDSATSTETTAPKKGQVQYETVTMEDGRIVDFAGKTRLMKTAEVKDGVHTVRLDFRNGVTKTFTLPQDLLSKFALHGAEQKLGDEVAGVTDLDDAVIAIEELIARLDKGEWAVRREPGSSVAGSSVLVRALVEQSGKTAETIKAFLANKSHAEKMALRANPSIKPIIDRLEAEKAAKATKKGPAVDTDALLAELA